MTLPDTGVSGAHFIPGYRDWKDERTSWQLSTWLLGRVDGKNRAKIISAPDTFPVMTIVHEKRIGSHTEEKKLKPNLRSSNCN